MAINPETLRQLSRDGRQALAIGTAAEHLVCADLILNGMRCYLSGQGLPYDVILDVAGRLYRIQVKAACFPRRVGRKDKSSTHGYVFSVRRRGKLGDRRLDKADGDIVAMVALDSSIIAYMPLFDVGQTCELMAPGHKFVGRYVRRRMQTVDQFPIDRALQRLASGEDAVRQEGGLHLESGWFELDGERLTLAGWGKRHGIDPRVISNRISRGWPLRDAITRPISKHWSRARRDRQ